MSEKQTEEALPMFNRDEIATEAGFFDVMFRLHDIKRECVMPAKVEKYDRSTRLATIKPLVQKFKTTQDGKVFWDRDSYEEIPVVSPFHGGFAIDFPVNEGDQGYLIAIDRPWDEIFDTIQEKGKEWDGKPSRPDDESLATFEQGIFIPSNYGRILIDDEDEGNLVIARVDKDGNVDGRIAVGDRFVDIDMDTTVHGSLTVKDDERDRKAVVDAKDLGDTDAKFREVTVVTGFKEKVGKIVKLFAKKFRVLADEQNDDEDVEIEVGGGGAALKLQYGDDEPVVYDGEEEKEFFVPAPPEPIVPGDGTLSMKVNGVEQATFTANQNTNSEFNVVIPAPPEPIVPGDGTLSMKVNGVEQATFTANQNTNSEFNVVIPTPPEPIVPGDGTLSMKVNGVEQATFTANQNTNSEFNVVIPAPPEPIVPGDGKLTIKVNGSAKTFTANQTTNTSVDITTGLAISGSAPTSIGDNVIIVAMRYDYAGSHQIQVKVRGMVFANGRIVGVTPVSDWLMIDGGQCVEHQQEV